MLKNPLFWTIAIVGLILDQVTKYWVAHSFVQVGSTIAIVPNIFHLTYVTNTGAAFSLFAGGADWLRWLSLAVSLGLIALAWFGGPLSKIEQLGYGSLLAGAVGNGVCRFLNSFVIDFLDFRWINFPVFNLADICINIGFILLLIASFRPTSSSRKPRPK